MRFIAEVSEPTKKFWQSEQKVNTEMRNSIRLKAITFCIGLLLGVVDVKPILARAQSLPKVVIGYPASSIASIQLFIAQEKGFFREEGLEAQLNQVRADAAIAAV
jgi:ABC-type nitrate/sulfonate/bicarbonate transport system substrate-binding protein